MSENKSRINKLERTLMLRSKNGKDIIIKRRYVMFSDGVIAGNPDIDINDPRVEIVRTNLKSTDI